MLTKGGVQEEWTSKWKRARARNGDCQREGSCPDKVSFFTLISGIWFELVTFPRRVTSLVIYFIHLGFGSTSAPRTDSV